jgi:hypothetical protein
MTAADRLTADQRADRRADRLLWWYPRSWRTRYGDEFTELLSAEIAEQPRSLRRDVNVAASGLRNRLAQLALTGHPFDQRAAAKARLSMLIWCAAACGLLGAAMWSQLAIGRQWAAPAQPGVGLAFELMTGAMLAFAMLAALLLASASSLVLGAIRRRQSRKLWLPVLLIGFGTTVIFIGGRHFANAWPGTGGHLLAHQALIPAWLAAFCWAATMWITSYLAHPGALAAFPVGQLAWMAACPAAIGALITGAARLLRGVGQSPGALRYEKWLAGIAGAGLLLLTGGALSWLLSPGAGVIPAFHVGLIDKATMLAVVLLAAAGWQALRHRGLGEPAGH